MGSPEPKVEYVTYYQSTVDVKRGAEGWLAKAVLGEEVGVNALSRPFAIASDGKGRVFVSDLDYRQVRVFDLGKHELRILGGGYTFNGPAGIAVGASGEVYVCDSLDAVLHVFGPDEKHLKKIAADVLTRPAGLAVDSVRGRLFVADPGSHSVLEFDLDGQLVRTLGGRGQAEGRFNYPLDLDIDVDGNLYVLDSMNARVQVFDPAGEFLRAFGERGTASGSFQVAKSLSVSPSGFVFVSDSKAHQLVVFDLEGNYMLSFGGRYPVAGGDVKPGGLYLPQGVEVDDTDSIWVVDSLNRMFHQFQYLNAEYLSAHPIRPEEVYVPNVTQ